jgi:hypothetical protein
LARYNPVLILLNRHGAVSSPRLNVVMKNYKFSLILTYNGWPVIHKIKGRPLKRRAPGMSYTTET